jgi:hypothetical protein
MSKVVNATALLRGSRLVWLAGWAARTQRFAKIVASVAGYLQPVYSLFTSTFALPTSLLPTSYFPTSLLPCFPVLGVTDLAITMSQLLSNPDDIAAFEVKQEIKLPPHQFE